ncbi:MULTISPECIES: response regulator [unclassified Colwellia]|uniref:response regulator n=1 Tax=unclassified Colwellia TaxID=196834 RepID=UPI0015F4338B|nr:MULTISPECIES: response regulator [unclassified Colwellia]MBA6363396.1 response regulator [Colwellia sp. BRX8-8]MBA6348994.1 response regulator [Colwellia sp. BRX8-9]MBA6351955.1 response regulator [Colwellia sp. BRX9-1]MBA6354969.1 response regulator [Colwellia sp. BRX8-3]MBA6359856.1 response regulator [Colwellia sp. BRX8-6]
MQHHNIILYTTEREDSELLIKVLIEHFDKVLVVTALPELEKQLKDETPKIILIDATSFQRSLMIYYSSLKSVLVGQTCEHFIVSVVSAREENEAYEAYDNDIIDDYIITNPLYEKKRAVVVCSNLLTKLGIGLKKNAALDYIYNKESYAKEIRETVLHGLELKERLRLSFEESITDVEHSISKATEQIKLKHNVNINLDVVKNILASIRSNEIRPRLVELQSKALDLLSGLISDVENIAQESNEAAQSDKSEQVHPPTSFNKLYNASNADAVKELDKIQGDNKSAAINILLVEDDPISIHLTNTLLHKYKLNVQTASTGRTALICLNNIRFDIVLLDVSLPDTNGLYILGQMKQGNGKNFDTPLIMLTGNKNKQIVKKAIELGAKGYLIKPLTQGVVAKLFKENNIPLIEKR